MDLNQKLKRVTILTFARESMLRNVRLTLNHNRCVAKFCASIMYFLTEFAFCVRYEAVEISEALIN